MPQASPWTPSTWRERPAAQQPEWPDDAALDQALKALAGLPPLVFAGEADALRDELAAVARGEAFLLQAGDCAESFDFSADGIRDKLKIILQMAVVLTYSAGVPTVKVGRIAGQFAKPRSNTTETVSEVELPVFRGHMVNDPEFSATARTADPQRLLQAYNQSAATLNLVRAFTKGGFADLRRVHAWNHDFVQASPEGRRYEELASNIEAALQFMQACGVSTSDHRAFHEVDFFTSHEALILGYEEALTRRDSISGNWYDCSAHMVWIGDRTRQLDGAHVEFFRGIQNPVGCKIGPTATPADVVAMCDALDPDGVPGRLTLISRMGADKVRVLLPPIIEAVRATDHAVAWACDPMHGNTFTAANGLKTRHFDAVLDEIRGFFDVHRALGTWPGGIHVELTGEDVTECLGGAEALEHADLERRYETVCDPRLNASQSLELAFQVCEHLSR